MTKLKEILQDLGIHDATIEIDNKGGVKINFKSRNKKIGAALEKIAEHLKEK